MTEPSRMIKETHVHFCRKFEKLHHAETIYRGWLETWKRVCSTMSQSLYVDVGNQIKEIEEEAANVRGEDREHLSEYTVGG